MEKGVHTINRWRMHGHNQTIGYRVIRCHSCDRANLCPNLWPSPCLLSSGFVWTPYWSRPGLDSNQHYHTNTTPHILIDTILIWFTFTTLFTTVYAFLVHFYYTFMMHFWYTFTTLFIHFSYTFLAHFQYTFLHTFTTLLLHILGTLFWSTSTPFVVHFLVHF